MSRRAGPLRFLGYVMIPESTIQSCWVWDLRVFRPRSRCVASAESPQEGLNPLLTEPESPASMLGLKRTPFSKEPIVTSDNLASLSASLRSLRGIPFLKTTWVLGGAESAAREQLRPQRGIDNRLLRSRSRKDGSLVGSFPVLGFGLRVSGFGAFVAGFGLQVVPPPQSLALEVKGCLPGTTHPPEDLQNFSMSFSMLIFFML